MTAALLRDTALGEGTNTDGITSDPTIAGFITGTDRLKRFFAGFNNTPTNKFFNVLSDFKPDGSFTFNRTKLEQIFGGTIPDSPHTLHLFAQDKLGNAEKLSLDVSFTLDTQAPSVPTSLALLAESDSGQSNTDNITNNTTPTIQGTGEAGSLIQLFKEQQLVGQTTATADGNWQLATSTLSNGVQALTATATDIAGNLSAPSTALALTIDTALPNLAMTNPVANASLTPGALLVGSVDGTGSTVATLTYRLDNLAAVPVSLSTTGAFNQELDVSQIDSGSHTLTVSTTDLAGNATTQSFSVQVNKDTTPPVIAATLANDTAAGGVTNADGITADPTMTGTVTDASAIASFRAGFDQTPVSGFFDVTADLSADGSFTFNRSRLEEIYGGFLPDGAYTLHLLAADAGGNISNVFDVAFTLDTQSTAPTGLNLLATNDSGQSNSDRITNVTTPTITGNAEAGAIVQVSSSGQLLVETTATTNGTWQIATSNLADGTYSLTAIATDVAGNNSSVSAPLNVVIDTQAPVAPSDLKLTAATDTGASNSDNITDNTKPTIQGTGEAGSLIRLIKDEELVGQTTATADGDWQISVETLSNGEHTFTARAEDIAGNVSASEGQLVVTIETQPDVQTQALAQLYGLDPYPDAVTLVPGTTRQLSVLLNGLPDSPDLTDSSAGTQYSVSDSDVLSVSSDGLITALSSGEATVTVKYGEAEVVIPVQVEAPQSGPVTVGADGGVVQASDGSMVAIAPGALEENTTVSLTPLSQSDLSLPVPEGFEVAGAFNLEMDDDALSVPAQLAIPAPEGLPVGTAVVFMRKGVLPDETGTWNPIWLQEESGVVGDDGMIRTQSPPFPGVAKPGEYVVAYSGPTGSATLVKGKITLNYNFPLAFFGIIIPGKAPGQNFGQLVDPSNFVTTSAFSVTYDISNVKVIAVPAVGLPVITTVGVQRNADGIATFETNLNIPAPTNSGPTAPPILQKVELKFKDQNNQPFQNNEPVLFLTGSNVLVNNSSTSKGSSFNDLIVNFYVGEQAYFGTVLPSLSQVLPNNQFSVAVKVPPTVPLGVSRIVLSRKQDELVGQNSTQPVYQEVQSYSNEIRLKSGDEYVFAALAFSDQVAVLNGSNPESVVSTTSSNDLLLAKIPVGTDGPQDRPQAIAVTREGNRAYVTLEGTGSVALVDPIVLQQVDTQSLTPEVNPISLPSGAKPRSIVISPWDEYAYIADASSAKIYVLDINPFSETYHQVIQTISVGPAPSGLRQMAISSDGRKLFAAAPASTSRILVVNIDFQDQPAISSQNPRKWHEQIGAVVANDGAEGLAATSNSLVMTFTNSRSDASGYGVLEVTNSDPLSFAATTRYASLRLGSIYDYFDVNNAVATEVTDDLSYAFVVGRNAINFGSGESVDGVQAGSNIGIIQDPLGPSPKLIAATRPIPGVAFATDLELSNDNKYLYASYPNAGGVYVFDVEEIINTIQNPGNYVIDNLDRGTGSPFFQPQNQRSATFADFGRVPIDDINPNISIAADYEILQENRPANQFVYGVPANTTRGPIGTGGSPRGLSASPELNQTPREEVQEISRKIAINIRNGNQPNLPAPDKERLDKNIAKLQKQRSLPLIEFVRQVQADPGTIIVDDDPAKGIYAILFEAAGQDDQEFYGTSSVIWNLAPVSQSVFSIGEDIASQPNNAPLPPGVLFTTPLGVGGSTIQGRVQPYPGDIDFSERFEIKAPNINSAAIAAANTIKELLERTRNNPNFEFQELVISTLQDGIVGGRPKKTLSYEEIVGGSKFDKLVNALKNLNSQTGNVNTFWRAKVDGNRFIDISKILDITAKQSTSGQSACHFCKIGVNQAR